MVITVALAGHLLLVAEPEAAAPDRERTIGVSLIGSAAAVRVATSILYWVSFSNLLKCWDTPTDGFDLCGIEHGLIVEPVFASVNYGLVNFLAASGGWRLARTDRFGGAPARPKRWKAMIAAGGVLHSVGVAGSIVGHLFAYASEERSASIAAFAGVHLSAAAQAAGLGLVMYGAASYRNHVRASLSPLRGGASLSIGGRF